MRTAALLSAEDFELVAQVMGPCELTPSGAPTWRSFHISGCQGGSEHGFLRQPPELVIEVLSKDTSWTKMEGKVADYHAMGVDLVWVLDPQTVTLRSYTGVGSPLLLRDTDTATADPHVPGFSVSVGAFFEE